MTDREIIRKVISERFESFLGCDDDYADRVAGEITEALDEAHKERPVKA